MIVLSDHLPIVALVSHYPTNELIGRGPLTKRFRRTFPVINEDHSTCGISHPFGQLFPTSRSVTHALLSRLPLTPKGAFDLHVLGTPPAFTLSQDQTLHHEFSLLRRPASRLRPLTVQLLNGVPRLLFPTLLLFRCTQSRFRRATKGIKNPESDLSIARDHANCPTVPVWRLR